MLVKLRYYLTHPAEADAVAAAGRLRLARDHMWRRRL
ncbi:glycosyltransferase family protein [Paenibacillus sp. SYP-B4298]